MLSIRVIPCLDVRGGRVVKGVRFQQLREVGIPEDLALKYEHAGADEVVLLDVSATSEDRRACLQTIRRVRDRISIPLSVGGGVRTVRDAGLLLDAGADKVAVNSAAIQHPDLVTKIADRFGRQCAVLAIDAVRTQNTICEVVTHSGTQRTGIDASKWAREGVSLGAGEILLTSWDRDGTRTGYDLELIASVSKQIDVPLIASGGASTPSDFADAICAGADAVLTASIFHDNRVTINDAKCFLANAGLEMRPC